MRQLKYSLKGCFVRYQILMPVYTLSSWNRSRYTVQREIRTSLAEILRPGAFGGAFRLVKTGHQGETSPINHNSWSHCELSAYYSISLRRSEQDGVDRTVPYVRPRTPILVSNPIATFRTPAFPIASIIAISITDICRCAH